MSFSGRADRLFFTGVLQKRQSKQDVSFECDPTYITCITAATYLAVRCCPIRIARENLPIIQSNNAMITVDSRADNGVFLTKLELANGVIFIRRASLYIYIYVTRQCWNVIQYPWGSLYRVTPEIAPFCTSFLAHVVVDCSHKTVRFPYQSDGEARRNGIRQVSVRRCFMTESCLVRLLLLIPYEVALAEQELSAVGKRTRLQSKLEADKVRRAVDASARKSSIRGTRTKDRPPMVTAPNTPVELQRPMYDSVGEHQVKVGRCTSSVANLVSCCW